MVGVAVGGGVDVGVGGGVGVKVGGGVGVEVGGGVGVKVEPGVGVEREVEVGIGVEVGVGVGVGAKLVWGTGAWMIVFSSWKRAPPRAERPAYRRKPRLGAGVEVDRESGGAALGISILPSKAAETASTMTMKWEVKREK
jgi:hypothetical protein